MSEINQAAYEKTDKLTAASAGAGADLLLANQSSKDRKMTLTQLATFMSTNLGSVTLDDITVSSMTLSSLPVAGSAMTFTVTGATSGAIGAVTSGDGNCIGFATVGQIEALIETVKDNKAAIDVIRS